MSVSEVLSSLTGLTVTLLGFQGQRGTEICHYLPLHNNLGLPVWSQIQVLTQS